MSPTAATVTADGGVLAAEAGAAAGAAAGRAPGRAAGRCEQPSTATPASASAATVAMMPSRLDAVMSSSYAWR